MGKKNRLKNRVKSAGNNIPAAKEEVSVGFQNKLSPQKRSEVSQLVEKLMKVCASFHSSAPNVSKEWDTYLQIHKILTKIISIEKELAVPLPARNESALKPFIEWVEANGGEVNGVFISFIEGYDIGIKANRALSEGEQLICIPRKLMMTIDNVISSILGPLLNSDTMLRNMPNIALALFLLVERFRTDKESFWLPYLNMLPNHYTTVLYFTPEQLQELRGSPALEPALKQCRNIARQYAYFYKLFQNNSDPGTHFLQEIFTYEQYRWAVSTVMTRQNFIPGSGGGNTPAHMVNALIPMWDMFNHSNGRLSTDFNLVGDRSECMAWRDFKRDEQIFIFYGVRSNADLLVHNGFVFMDNKYDSVKLRLGVSKSDPLQPLRSKLLSKLSLPSSADFALSCGSEPVDNMLLAFLRIFCMDQDELSYWLDKEQYADLLDANCALNAVTEKKVWNFLLNRINLLLASYPTSFQADMELMEERIKVMPICQQLPIYLRICEKKILQSVIEYVKQRIQIV